MITTLLVTFGPKLLRQVLQAAAGALAAYGVIEGGQVEALTGIGMSIVTAVWMMFANNKTDGK